MRFENERNREGFWHVMQTQWNCRSVQPSYHMEASQWLAVIATYKGSLYFNRNHQPKKQYTVSKKQTLNVFCLVVTHRRERFCHFILLKVASVLDFFLQWSSLVSKTASISALSRVPNSELYDKIKQVLAKHHHFE